ncbi:MAG TPA: MmcQ/YjbR family DNA-binding protein [Steroidobacteraceae bacterium]|nr:MmcQ/YjbR family DNA-binding protein [Steroidobacteraceae bacterium]
MAKDISAAVREVCLWLPESEEYLSHGAPNFRVRGKTYATYAINHHGDGRVALWLNSPDGAQDHYTRTQADHFFIPPYVGPRGWLGVHLDKGLPWERIATLVRQAYEKVAPAALVNSLGRTPALKPPPAKLPAEDRDPLQSRTGQAILRRMRKLCLSWPETSEGLQFGWPVWRAGKRTFASIHAVRDARGRPRLQLYFWVGVAAQALMTDDRRFGIPAYLGHQGWIALDTTSGCDWGEVRELALASYRHFALRRMLAALD